jgi:hypothetical protein
LRSNLEYRVAFRAIHDVLINDWDPIGVNDAAEAQDEYDDYVPVIFRLIREGARDEDIAKHLEHIARDWIGLSRNPAREACNLQVVRRLREVLAWLNN